MSEVSRRRLRVGALVRSILSEALLREDPPMGAILTEAEMSADLRVARVYVRPGHGRGIEETLASLESSSGALRSALASRLDMKFVPSLRWLEDSGFERAERIDALLRSPKVSSDLIKGGAGDESPAKKKC